MVVPLPDEATRWRCTRCGNLTRFDVIRSERTEEFWHFDLAGQPDVESRTVLSGGIESVACRWCGSADSVEVVSRASVDD